MQELNGNSIVATGAVLMRRACFSTALLGRAPPVPAKNAATTLRYCQHRDATDTNEIHTRFRILH
jgi:hypothetical protein